MDLSLKFHIEMTSDYHIGAGFGEGTEIDSALMRSVDGQPVIRGTVLTGLLRDALWQLLQQTPMEKYQKCKKSGKAAKQDYCGQYDASHFEICPICQLFGSPRTRKHWHISSASPVESQVTSTRVTRLRINPDTRRAKPRQLFTQDQGGITTFSFVASCSLANDSILDEAALLVAAARYIRRLGRSRQRGQGECRISLQSVEGAETVVTQKDLLLRFENKWLRAYRDVYSNLTYQDLLTITKPAEELQSGQTELNQEMRFRLLVLSEEPVIISQRASAGNQFHGQSSIPGRVVRGAMAASASARFNLEDPHTQSMFNALFLSGDMRFTDLNPLYYHKKSGSVFGAVQIPLDTFACKVHPEQHPHLYGTQTKDVPQSCSKCGRAVKVIRQKWASSHTGIQGTYQLFSPKFTAEMHNEINPESQRVEPGQLYEYIALQSQQYFCGELVFQDEQAWELFQDLTGLDSEEKFLLYLGKASRRGYGKVLAWLTPVESGAPVFDTLQPLKERVKVGDKELTLTLLSDTILTDSFNRFVTGFDGEILNEVLNQNNRPGDQRLELTIQEGKAFASSIIIDGYNTKHHLPTWRDIALASGSIVRLDLGEPLTQQQFTQLEILEREGIGLRRSEGFGRIMFGHPLTPPPFKVPRGLALDVDQPADTSLHARWLKSVNQQLGKHKDTLQGEHFVALARWLHTRCRDPLSETLAAMDMLGTPDMNLKDLIGGPDEYGDRTKENRLAGQPGFKAVRKLLEKLQKESPECHEFGIRVLADALSSIAVVKEVA